MRTLAGAAIAAAVAFGIGMSGVPGHLVSGVTAWLADTDRIELEGPVGDAVRAAFPEVDTGTAAAEAGDGDT